MLVQLCKLYSVGWKDGCGQWWALWKEEVVGNFTVFPAFVWRKSFDRLAGLDVRNTFWEFLVENQESKPQLLRSVHAS
jgi:hypothetical protein